MVVEEEVINNSWMCGWKDDKGEVHDVEKVQAANAASAKYRYVKEILIPKYPKLAEFRVASLVMMVYAGTGKNPDTKLDLKDASAFYKAIKSK